MSLGLVGLFQIRYNGIIFIKVLTSTKNDLFSGAKKKKRPMFSKSPRVKKSFGLNGVALNT